MDLKFLYEMKKLNLRHRDYGYKIADESTKDFSSCLFKTLLSQTINGLTSA